MSCCSTGSCTVCKIAKGFTVLVLTLTTIAAFIGVWRTHMLTNGWMFGSGDGSLALLVLVISITLWTKGFHKMCGCGGCACGSKGMAK